MQILRLNDIKSFMLHIKHTACTALLTTVIPMNYINYISVKYTRFASDEATSQDFKPFHISFDGFQIKNLCISLGESA
jgi:hypothetical protein